MVSWKLTAEYMVFFPETTHTRAKRFREEYHIFSLGIEENLVLMTAGLLYPLCGSDTREKCFRGEDIAIDL